MTSHLVRKPAFWIVVLVASAICVFSVLHWFGDAFSVLDLDVRMSRTTAIDDARRLARDRRLIDVAPVEAAARFDGDSSAQTFIELEGGGKPALKPLLGSGEFTLYKWRVRLFTPGVEREVQIAFTPDGRPAGFFVRVPEAAAGASLSADDARALAIAAATKDWNVDFTHYRALTASATTRPGKRIDHEFVYERTGADTPAIGDGRLRLTMVVSGDRLTRLSRTIYVPEAFARRYATLRSVNNNIAAGASVAAGLLYGLGGCLIGLIWLMRRHALQWAPSAKWAAVVALLVTGAGLSNVSGSWFAYDTATSASTHLYTRIGGALVGGVATWLLLTVVFATAEGMGRLAFGNHPQLWRTWCAPSANSRQIWGRTLAGYAWIGFDLAFIALFYFMVDRYLGWWSPSDSLIDPNILGTPQPWLSPVSMALQAGMMEESLFRAIPIAGAALLGRHFGRQKTFIVVALVLQAIIFGCAHANYPGEPAYARPVELFLPALVWGIVYLRYGLVPGMLFHFGFDLVLMSIPLFVTEAPGIFFDRAMVVGILSLPLVVLIVQRVRAGRLIDLPASERNAEAPHTLVATAATEDAVLEVVDRVDGLVSRPAGSTDAAPPPVDVSTSTASLPFTRHERWILLVFAIVGVFGLGVRVAQPYDAPALPIDRTEALAVAEHALAERGIALDGRWVRSARAVGLSDAAGADFVWREGGAGLFAKLMGSAISPPHWEVRFARFDGDVAERDAWRVSLVDGRPAPEGIRVIEHDVPEARAGRRLTEAEARPLAEAAIATWLKRAAASLEPRSAQADERPSRVDWAFVYADPTVVLPKGGEARIAVEVDGDEVASVGRFLFIPDAWKREERSRNELLVIPRGLLAIIGAGLGIAVLVSLVRRIARGEGSKRAAWVAALLMIVTLSVSTWLRLDATEFGFTVAEPFRNQLLQVALSWAGTTAAGALFGALVAAVGIRIASGAERCMPTTTTSSASPRWSRWAAPLAIALLVAGVGGYAALTGASSSPRIPAVGAADSSAPWLLAFMSELGFTTAAAAALLGAAVLASRKRWMEVVVALLFVVSAMLTRAMAIDADAIAIVVAGIGGLIAWLIYHYLIRDRLWLIPPILLCLALIGQVLALAYEPWPGSRVANVLGAVATVVGYASWRWLVKTDRVSRLRTIGATPP